MSEREPSADAHTAGRDRRGAGWGASAPSRSDSVDDLTPDEERELMGLWLSRVMFGRLVDPALAPRYVETRTFEQFLSDNAP